MILALDINSKSTGAAFGGPGDAMPRTLTWKLYGCADEQDLARSGASLYRAITEISRIIKPRWLYYEAPFNPQDGRGHTNHQAVRALLSLAAVAMAAGLNSGAQIRPVHVQTWRKHFLGHGRPEDPKAVTMKRCELLGWSVANHDEADSAGIWCFAMLSQYPQWSPGKASARGAA